MPAVETKVKASTAAAAVSGLALWALGRYVFRGNVPDVVASWVDAIIPAGLAFAAGYWAKHTGRPGDPPAAPGQAVTVATPAPTQAQTEKWLADSIASLARKGTLRSPVTPPPAAPSGPEMVTSAEILRGRPAPPDVQPPPAQPPAAP